MAYNPCGVNSTSQLLFKEALSSVFRGEMCIGRAVFAAKCSVIARYPTNDNLYGPAVLWTILGDPALRLKYRVLSGLAERPGGAVRPAALGVVPNPVRGPASVSFSVPISGPVSLQLFDEAGTMKQTLVSGRKGAGEHIVRLPSGLAPGVYILTLEVGRSTETAKLVVVR